MDLNSQQHILETVYAARIDPAVTRRFYLASLSDYEREIQSQTWFKEVIKPLNANISRTKAIKYFLMEITVDEFTADFTEDQLDKFLDKFEELQTAFITKHQGWWE